MRERVGVVPSYGRVDLINDPDGVPLVLEVELVDPYLWLDAVPAAAAKLVAAVVPG
ncbi:MAG: hypothetical protein JO337_11330 [Acidimicrobiales bacterium]|nr:hypothetical protein [Acidimicrobiales bacterium]